MYVVLNCGDPGIPLHGRRHGKLFTYGAKVWFSCHSHTTLVGIQTITCNEHGRWSSPRPLCRSMSVCACVLSVCMRVCTRLSVCLSIYLSVCLSLDVCTYVSVCLSACLSVYGMSVYVTPCNDI